MAKRIKSGLKRRRQDEVRRARNRAARTRVRNAVRQLRSAIDGGDREMVRQLLPQTVSILDVGVRKGVLHRNTASRVKSRLTTHVNRLLQHS
ncbi:MAG: 30S ribosomal protein S20 [Thermoanaerobaculaceae bacterium]|nr:30S ribosomal protein S20 [Thermoanaerobaculaceae bacterium]